MKLVPAAANAKVLVPLATMLAAGAVAVGSGATFTSQSIHTASVTAGSLSHTNDKDAAVLTIANIKPGDSKTGTLTITNNGTIDALASVKASGVGNTFASNALSISIDEVDQTGAAKNLYSGDFTGLGTQTWQLGALDVKQALKVTYTVTLASTAGDGNQGKTAAATFTYVTTQNDGHDNATTTFQ
ncbi:MAG: TasA family protein [Marmoricola sp.]